MAHGKDGEAQTHHPALGFRFDNRRDVIVHIHLHHLFKEASYFRWRETQILDPYFGYLPTGTQFYNRKRGIAPRGDGQMHVAGGMNQQPLNQIVNGGVANGVVIIQNQDEILTDGIHLVNQVGGKDIQRR